MSFGELPLGLLGYGGVMVAIWLVYARLRSRRTKRGLELLEESRRSGLMEPASLHPVIDPSTCLGCATCAEACPEQNVLAVIRGKAKLVKPANCIGHGACKTACPVDAITLVLGTETRGVDIPVVGPDFQTNVPGIFVAGELGGMGLVRNAIEQGRQAIDSVRRLDGLGRGDRLDVVVVGAGPAGFSASLSAMKHGLRCETLEQDTLGGTVAHYPRGKIVMTAPVEIPLFGRVKLRETTKESLLELWERVEKETGARIRYRERVESIEPCEDGFEVRSSGGVYRTRAVVLAIGRRGTPRKLGIPGEESEKVVYRLVDPEQYRGRNVLVVGGGDSALEAATSLADEPGTEVALSYRGDAFSRAKQKNRERVDAAVASDRLRLMLGSQVKEIGGGRVVVEGAGGVETLANDAVIVCAGGVLPTGFLGSIGVEMETRHGEV